MENKEVGEIDSRGKFRVQTINDDESMTVQSDAHLADITAIMRRYGQEGLELLDETKLMYADVSEFTDLADAFRQAKVAEVEFMKLPSKVREIFDHDVAVWLDTAHDQEKRDALVEAGFIKVKEESTKRRGRREGELQQRKEADTKEADTKKVAAGEEGPKEEPGS